MERLNTKRRRAEENAHLQAKITEDLTQLETKILNYLSNQYDYASDHDAWIVSRFADRAFEMKKDWNSYVEMVNMRPNYTNNDNFVTKNGNNSREQFYPNLNHVRNNRKRIEYREIPEKEYKTKNNNQSEPPSHVNKNLGISVTTSFNDVGSKSRAIEKLNEVIEKYSYVFDITAKKQIKVPKV